MDLVPLRLSVTNFMLIVLSVLEFKGTVGIERNHQRLLRRDRPHDRATKQHLPAHARSSALQLGHGRRQTSQITLKSSGALVANSTPVGIAYTRATSNVAASASRRALEPRKVHQHKQVQAGLINSHTPLDEPLNNILGDFFTIDSSGIDRSPSDVGVAEHHQVQPPPPVYATATQPPIITVTMTALQQIAPTFPPVAGPTSSVPTAAPGQTQAEAVPTTAPDSGDGGGMIFFIAMVLLVGGALVAIAFVVRLKMQGGGSSSRLAGVTADESSFYQSAKYRQSSRKTLTDDTGRSDDDDTINRRSSAASTSNSNYHRRDRPYRGLSRNLSSRNLSASLDAQQLEDAGDSNKEGSQSPRQGSESSRQRSQSPRQGSKPPREGSQPPRQGSKPPREGSQPPRQGSQPPRQRRVQDSRARIGHQALRKGVPLEGDENDPAGDALDV